MCRVLVGLLVVVQLVQASTAVPDTQCPYGSLPGQWKAQPQRPIVAWGELRWQPFDPRCQLEDLLGKALRLAESCLGLKTPDCVVAKAKPINLIMVGDSIERYTVTDVCDVLRSQAVELIEGYGHYCCRLYGFNICNIHIFGSWAEGPYSKGFYNPGNVPNRDFIRESLGVYKQHGIWPPDALVFSSNLWDWTNVWAADPALQKNEFGAPLMDRNLLDTYITDMEMLMMLLKNLARNMSSSPALLYHTTAQPAARTVVGSPSWDGHPHLLGYVAQYNQAARCVADSVGFETIDMEGSTNLFAVEHDQAETLALRDFAHPQPYILRNMVNIYLNYAASKAQHDKLDPQCAAM